MEPSKLDPPQFDRLAVKREILRASDDGKIPTLTYIHLEIIDPDAVELWLLEELDAGTWEGGLTDNLFFELLSESPDYLAFEPFRKKIKGWQDGLHNHDEEARAQAKNNLRRIGEVLALDPKGKGRPEELNEQILLINYLDLIPIIKSFLEEHGSLNQSEQETAFKEKYPGLASYVNLGTFSHRSYKAIAREIVCAKHNINERTFYKKVKAYLPSCQK